MEICMYQRKTVGLWLEINIFMNSIFRFFLSGLLVLTVVSCKEKQTFEIKGYVENAQGETLYLEHIGIEKIELSDSVKLKKGGKFSFKHDRPESPDFYRLRLKRQFINIGIDSTEIVEIQAGVSAGFAKEYKVTGSENCLKIKELTLLQIEANNKFNLLQKNKATLSDEEYKREVSQITDRYKQEAKKYILQDPLSSAAYFALFQQVNNMLIFNPYDKEDHKMYATLATSWDIRYKDSQRAKHLYALAMQSLKVIRGQRVNHHKEIEVKEATNYFEIQLPDLHDNIIMLSDITSSGRVVLLDFTAYQTQFSPIHNMFLGEVYEKYQEKGFEIYQVSLDEDIHFWKNVASNIPWKCVRDQATVYSKNAAKYNVRELPATFIFNRKGEIVKRIESTDYLEAEIKKVL